MEKKLTRIVSLNALDSILRCLSYFKFENKAHKHKFIILIRFITKNIKLKYKIKIISQNNF